MKKTWVATAAVMALGAVMTLAPTAMAQRGDGQGGPGGNRGQRGFGGLIGTIESISDTELTVTLMGGGRPGGQRPGGERPQQGGDQPPRTITVKLNGETAYRELAEGKEDDLAKGVFVSAAGDGEDTIDAKAIATCEAAPEDTEGTAALRALMLVRGPLMMFVMRSQPQGGDPQDRPRIGFAMGELINEIPYTVKARSRDGERDVTLTVADATRYFKVAEIKHDDLVKGRLVSIAPVRPEGQPRPGGQAGNNQAFDPRQGGDQPPQDITASMIMLMPEMQRPGGGGAPVQ